jgi:hypothetical protein
MAMRFTIVTTIRIKSVDYDHQIYDVFLVGTNTP